MCVCVHVCANACVRELVRMSVHVCELVRINVNGGEEMWMNEMERERVRGV